jgi:hypothetical protein
MSSEKYSILGNNKISFPGILRKWMIRLNVNLTTGNKRRIDNAVRIRPLKNIRFDRMYKSNAFKGLEYKKLFYVATIASRYLFQKHLVP